PNITRVMEGDYAMSVSIVNDVQIEVRRLAVAGSDVAVGDNRMKRLSLEIRRMEDRLPVFARLAGSIESLTNPEAGSPAGNLLEAATLTNALLYTQGVFGVEGELVVPESFGPDLPTSASYRTISLVREAVLRYALPSSELLEKVCEEGEFVDLRLLDTFIELLYSSSSDTANLVCKKILPAYGETILPKLLNGYNVNGRVGDGRRLELIAGILKEKGEDMYIDALKDGSEDVKVSALKCVGYVPESTDIIIEYSRSGIVGVRSAAFEMLAEINSEAASDRIIEALRNSNESYYAAFCYNDSKSELLVRKIIQEGDSCIACYQQKKVDPEISRRLGVVLNILRRSDSEGVREFFERCKGQPGCLVKITELSMGDKINIEDPDDRKNLLSALRLIVHSSFDHGGKGLPELICIAAHAAILEDDREAVDMIVGFVSDPSSPISRDFTYSIDNYTAKQLRKNRKKADFLVTRRLFEIALDIGTPYMSLFCNALWVMRKDNTRLIVDREMNEKFLEKCLPNGPRYPEIYFNAVCLYVEMDEYDKALECVSLAKKHNCWGYDGMMERIRTAPMFEDFRKDQRVMKIIEN
ncbi:MAG TPA: HEAT repeat domain-containing protein, partial [Methanocella sp.]|nr:HEAT repeat domain-containing protein [Methanocella sp.]